MSEGGEAGLHQLNDRVNSMKREVDRKTRERKEFEEKIKKLQKEVANVEVSTLPCSLATVHT